MTEATVALKMTTDILRAVHHDLITMVRLSQEIARDGYQDDEAYLERALQVIDNNIEALEETNPGLAIALGKDEKFNQATTDDERWAVAKTRIAALNEKQSVHLFKEEMEILLAK